MNSKHPWQDQNRRLRGSWYGSAVEDFEELGGLYYDPITCELHNPHAGKIPLGHGAFQFHVEPQP